MNLREDLKLLEEHLMMGGFNDNDIQTVRNAINFVDAIVLYNERQKRMKAEDCRGEEKQSANLS